LHADCFFNAGRFGLQPFSAASPHAGYVRKLVLPDGERLSARRACSAFPPPPKGRGWGEGVTRFSTSSDYRPNRAARDPSSRPSPQRGEGVRGTAPLTSAAAPSNPNLAAPRDRRPRRP
jgi:hypothetical protein